MLCANSAHMDGACRRRYQARVIRLYQLPGAWGVSSVSPFCVKVEAFLRFAGLPFESELGIPMKGPRGKVPWIDDDGVIVSDSQRIIDHLAEKHGLSLDAHLSPEQRTQGHTLRRMLEEGTYFAMVHLRWMEPSGWEVYQPVLAAGLPPLVGPLVLGGLRRGLRKALRGQGTGLHEPAHIGKLACDDFAALSTLLGERDFLFGDVPSSFDATAYAWVASVLGFPVPSQVRSFVDELPNLRAYRERIERRFYV